MVIKKIIVAPDSFKGTISATRAAEIIADELKKSFLTAEIVKMPVADGGEGSLDAILSVKKGKKQVLKVRNPHFEVVRADCAVLDDGIGVAELAQSSGITLVDKSRPMTATTFGFGQVISALLDKGLANYILCLGGSATTDGGCGMASALGVRFYDKSGENFIPTGKTLIDIKDIDLSQIHRGVRLSEFLAMCDVENPLFGNLGAAKIYAPQKGASAAQVELLNSGLEHLNRMLIKCVGMDFQDVRGAGAAGGLGAGVMAFLGAKLKSGIEMILNLYQFDREVMNADLIVTGEGKLDSQSLMGKVLSGVLKRSKGKAIVTFCGVNTIEEKELERHGITAVAIGKGMSSDLQSVQAEENLRNAARRFALQWIHAHS